MKVGAFFIPDLRPAGLGDDATGESLRGTAHVIQVLPEQELLVMAWYNAGVRVLDYSGLADLSGIGVGLGAGNESLTPGIQQVGWHRFTDTDLWSAHVHEVADDGSFFIFGGDTARALDIWEFDPTAGTSGDAEDRGTWLAASELTADAVGDLASDGLTLDSGYQPYCLINR